MSLDRWLPTWYPRSGNDPGPTVVRLNNPTYAAARPPPLKWISTVE